MKQANISGQLDIVKTQYDVSGISQEISYMNKGLVFLQLSCHEEGLACFFLVLSFA